LTSAESAVQVMAEMMIELVQELDRAFSARGCEFH
jgi:hypothetical protein